MEKIIGKTKKVGFQFGLRKTFSIPLENIHEFLLSEKGLNIWLGELQSKLIINEKFVTKEGIEGMVRVLKPFSHIRLNWKKKKWNNMSTLQVRLIRKTEKTTISFHVEKLLDSQQRDEMKKHLNEVMQKLTDEITKIYP
jgi:hypothetical protein